MHNSVSDQEPKSTKLLSMDLTSEILVLADKVYLEQDLLALTQILEVVALSQAALSIQKRDLNRMPREASLVDDDERFICYIIRKLIFKDCKS